MSGCRQHPNIQQGVAQLITVEPHHRFRADLHQYWRFVIQTTTNGTHKLAAQPCEPSARLRPFVRCALELSQLVDRKRGGLSMVRRTGLRRVPLEIEASHSPDQRVLWKSRDSGG
jgi:hypothetical protein